MTDSTELSTDVQAPEQEDLARRRLENAIDRVGKTTPPPDLGEPLTLHQAASLEKDRLAALREQERADIEAEMMARYGPEPVAESIEDKIDKLHTAIVEAPHNQYAVVQRYAAHQQASEDYANAVGAGHQAQQQVAKVFEQETKRLTEAWGDLNDQEIAEFSQTYEPFRQDMELSHRRINDAVHQAEQVDKQYMAALATISFEHDQLFMEARPEFRDPAVWQKANVGITQMLLERGYSPEDIVAGWTRSAGPLQGMRDYRNVSMLIDQYRLREHQKDYAEGKGKAKPEPPVHSRPGTRARDGRMGGDYADQTVRDLDERFAQTGSLRDAARFYTASRNNRRG